MIMLTQRPRLDRSALEQLLAGLTAVRGVTSADGLRRRSATRWWTRSPPSFKLRHGRPARPVHLRGDPGRARGGHRGQARRAGPCARRLRHLEDLTESVNAMAGNLTTQVRNIAQVATAVAKGDLTQKIGVEAQGEIPRAQDHPEHDGRPALRRSPLTRSPGSPARPHPGRPGRPGGGARRLRHLEGPDRQRQLDGRQPDQPGGNIAQVTTAVAEGTLTKRSTSTRGARSSAAQTTINTMVDQLSVVRGRGHPGGPRGRPGGQVGGQAQVEALGHLEAADQERQRAGREPGPPGPAPSPR